MSWGVAFDAELWLHTGEGGWHFVTVPAPESDEIRDRAGEQTRGFGSLRVEVTVGETTWATSIFPEKAGTYVLPVKKQVRRSEDLLAGDLVSVRLHLVDF